jgi:hypothetical protein
MYRLHAFYLHVSSNSRISRKKNGDGCVSHPTMFMQRGDRGWLRTAFVAEQKESASGGLKIGFTRSDLSKGNKLQSRHSGPHSNSTQLRNTDTLPYPSRFVLVVLQGKQIQNNSRQYCLMNYWTSCDLRTGCLRRLSRYPEGHRINKYSGFVKLLLQGTRSPSKSVSDFVGHRITIGIY